MEMRESIPYKGFKEIEEIVDFKKEGIELSQFEKEFISKRFNGLLDISLYLKFKKIKDNEFLHFLENLPTNMLNMDKALEITETVINNKKQTVIACDYDADGLGAASILKLGFNQLGYSHFSFAVSDRYKGGYGFNDHCVERVLKENPDLVITVDEGSSDENRIKKLKDKKSDIKFIVTDHHHVPVKKPPVSADAFINPNQPDDDYPYKYICGAFVALLFIKALAEKMNKKVDIRPLIEIATISTIGDVMPIQKSENRILLKLGLSYANSNNGLPFWKALKSENPIIDESTIGFNLAPKINAMSRMGKNPEIIINFLTSNDFEEIVLLFNQMTDINNDRKEINDVLYNLTFKQIETQKDDYSHIVYLEEGLSGVTGILASRIKEETGKPVICFLPKKDNEDYITGSGRSIEDVNIRETIEIISDEFNDIIYGGHPMACGLTLPQKDFLKFKRLFNQQLEKTLNNKPEKEYIFDFNLSDFNSPDEFIKKQNSLKPFGKSFEVPMVKVEGKLINSRIVGKGSLTGVLEFQTPQKIKTVKFIWFGSRQSKQDKEMEFHDGMNIKIIGKIDYNYFRGNATPQIMIENIFI